MLYTQVWALTSQDVLKHLNNSTQRFCGVAKIAYVPSSTRDHGMIAEVGGAASEAHWVTACV